MEQEFDFLGEHLGPCPCCHSTKKPIRTLAAVKGINSLVRNGTPFFLRVQQELLYVDRSRKVWAQGEGDKYTISRGAIRDFVNIAPPKVRNKKKVKKTKK